MTESIHSNVACVFTDKGSFSVIDSLGDTYYQVWCCLKTFLHFGNKIILIKSNFREIDQHRIVSFEFAGENAGSSEPSGMASHNLNNSYRFLIVVDRSVKCNFPYSRSHIFGSTSVSRCMICFYKVVIDGFWNADKADIAVNSGGIAG